MWNWFFGKTEEIESENCPCCNYPNCDHDHQSIEVDQLGNVVFDGTTTELLKSFSATKTEETMKDEMNYDASTGSINVVNCTNSNDSTWVNLEFLKMAFEIEKSKKQKLLFYVDVGNLPKKAAADYVKDLMKESNSQDKDGDYWLARRDGTRGTEVGMTTGRVNLNELLETAQKLKEFCKA